MTGTRLTCEMVGERGEPIALDWPAVWMEGLVIAGESGAAEACALGADGGARSLLVRTLLRTGSEAWFVLLEPFSLTELCLFRKLPIERW